MEGHAISFGPFRLLAAERLLLEGDKPVRLGSRAFDILMALIERAGELVAKEELVAKVWPNIFVEESSSRAASTGPFRQASRETNELSVPPPRNFDARVDCCRT